MTGLQAPDGEDWRVFWNKPEEVTDTHHLHINHSDEHGGRNLPGRTSRLSLAESPTVR